MAVGLATFNFVELPLARRDVAGRVVFTLEVVAERLLMIRFFKFDSIEAILVCVVRDCRIINGVYSCLSASTGCSRAARRAGNTLAKTAIPMAPMATRTTINGLTIVGISEK